MTAHRENSSSSHPAPRGMPLPTPEALRIAAQVTNTEEDLHAVTRMVLALVGADDDLTGADADAALARAGVPVDARRLLIAASGPPAERPSVAELRAVLATAAETGTNERTARSGLAGLFDELKGRRVIRTALWYVGGSVALVEAANVFVPMLGAPEAIVRVLAIAAVCGLPVALTLSWTFDVAPAARTNVTRWTRIALLAGVAVLSLATAVMIWRGGARADPAAVAAPGPGPDPAHIAVLGFDAVGGGEDLAAFAAQLQVRLIDGLSAAAAGPSAGQTRERQLRVLSHAGVLPFTHSAANVDSLRESRRVGTVLAGTVEQTRNGMRVRVRLIDTQTGDQIYASTAQVSSDDRLALLDAVADSVVHLVRERLGPVVRTRMRLHETTSRAAFDRVVWAAHRLEEFDPAFAREDYEAAEHVLHDADSAFAAAERFDAQWIEPIVERGIQAKRYARLARARRDSSGILTALDTGIAHAERALALSPTDPRALQLRGELLQSRLQLAPPSSAAERERIRDAAEHDLRASLIGNHSPARALRILSELAGSVGRMEEALQYGMRAYEQDPFMEQVQFTVFRLFEYSFALRDDSAAAHWCSEGRQRFDLPVFHDCRLALGAWSATYPLSADSAWALVAAELDASQPPYRPLLEPRLHAMAAAVLARNGMTDSARTVLRSARARDSTVGVQRAAAGVHGLLGESDSAVAIVRSLLEGRLEDQRTLRRAVELRPLENDLRVRALLDVRALRTRVD